jgi:hypothetical protein
MQAKYVHNMGNFSIHSVWLQILTFLQKPQHHSTLHCIYCTQKRKRILENCLQRELTLHFTVCLFTSTSTVANRTVIWWCTLPKHTCNLEGFGIISRVLSVSHHTNFKNDIHLHLFYTLRLTFYTSLCIFFRKLSHITATVLSLISSVSHIHTIFWWPYILHANPLFISRGLLIHLWGKWISLGIIVTTTYIIPTHSSDINSRISSMENRTTHYTVFLYVLTLIQKNVCHSVY